eukprot:gene9072-12234_t
MNDSKSSISSELHNRIYELKLKVGWLCSSSILSVPLNEEVPLLKINKNDPEATKQFKISENNRIKEQREIEQKKREPELIAELDKIIIKIKSVNENHSLDHSSGMSSISIPKMLCVLCGNKDLNNVVTDPLTGDSICTGMDGLGCGQVMLDHTVHEGAEKRNFEGEENRNHFGPAPDRLMPDVVNLETRLDTYSNGKQKSSWKRMSHTQQQLEINLSNLSTDHRHTREGYKTKQKREAFRLMAEIAANFNIHESVVAKAKEEFAKYRDFREAVQQYEGVVASCLVIAYEQLAETLYRDIAE